MTATYDLRLVGLSILIAVVAAYTALDLAARVAGAQGRPQQLWGVGGAIAMGIGIWSMHFVGMLAYSLPVPMTYDYVTVLLSMLVAVGASGLALYVVGRPTLDWPQLIGGGLLMGLGIAAMHYIGMAAMDVAAVIHYDPALVGLSIAVALSASGMALGLAFQQRSDDGNLLPGWAWVQKLGCAVIMGSAIAGTHYTAMAAVSYEPLSTLPTPQEMNQTLLAIGTGLTSLMILGLTLTTVTFDRRLHSEKLRRIEELAASERRFRSLVQNATDLTTLVDASGLIHYQSISVQRTLGYVPKALVGGSFLELVHPADRPTVTKILQKAGQTHSTLPAFEYRVRDANGAWIYLESVISNLLEDDSVQGLVINSRNIHEGKQIKAALLQERIFINAVLDHVEDGIVACDAEGKLLLFNRASQSFHNRGKEPVPPEQWAAAYNLLQADGQTPIPLSEIPLWQAFQGKTVKDVEMVVAPEQGQRRTLLASGQPLFDAQGQKLGAVVVMHDITEQKRAATVLHQLNEDLERKVKERTAELQAANEKLEFEITQRAQVDAFLWESKERFRNLVETTSDWVWEVNERFAYIYVSPKVRDILGYEPRELLGKTPADLMPAAEAQRFAKILNPLTVARQPFNCLENQSLHKDGSLIALETSGVPVFTADGVYRGFRGIARDITARKQAESALAESEERFRLLVEGVEDYAIFMLDPQGNIVSWNAGAERIKGYTAAEVIGKHFSIFYPPEELADAKPERELQLASTEGRFAKEGWQVRKDGTWFWASLLITPLRDDHGTLRGFSKVTRDITERKLVEENIRLALEKERDLSELKSRFISMTSHEFRTPLTTILSSAELLEHYSHKWDDHKRLGHLHRIQEAVKHMTELLNDVLVISRAEAGRLPLNPAPLDLVTFCQQLVETLQVGSKSGHTIQIVIEGEPRSAIMDAKALRQILYNLLSNAIKYSPADKPVQLGLVFQPQQLCLRVQDQGIGIPAEDQPHLFEPFHRATNVGTVPGTGLGLAVVKRCVDLQGGEIAFTSQQGIGTTFTITLPLTPGNYDDYDSGN